MSAKQETYFVFPLENLWMVSCERELDVWGPYSSRAEALRMAKAFARINRPAEVKLKGPGGQWQVEQRYGDSVALPAR